ncbi:granzyme A-like [Metopolophium dirhodum]|uniref:granzyme A-like n=1 Tax=Metopolophium dirhodum TaxID=44670 RepID=UPI0029905D40|nr:granzyme A-like [Metopolophium dirhodum]
MFGNFDAAAKLMQLCRRPLVVVVVVLVVAVADAEIELQQETVLTGGGRSSGSEITAEYPYLVGLTIEGIVDKTNRKTTICTGTLVSPVLVLSSAYCTLSLTTTINDGSEVTTLFAYWKTPTNSVKYHRATSVFTHPSYDKAKRICDLSLIKLKKPFKHVERFVRLSSKALNSDVELSCVVVGIGAPHERGYKVPVRVKYGLAACRVPKSK